MLQFSRKNLVLDKTKCFECLDGTMIINRNGVCDKIMDCSDLSDECLCDGNLPIICEKVKNFFPKKKYVAHLCVFKDSYIKYLQ